MIHALVEVEKNINIVMENRKIRLGHNEND